MIHCIPNSVPTSYVIPVTVVLNLSAETLGTRAGLGSGSVNRNTYKGQVNIATNFPKTNDQFTIVPLLAEFVCLSSSDHNRFLFFGRCLRGRLLLYWYYHNGAGLLITMLQNVPSLFF